MTRLSRIWWKGVRFGLYLPLKALERIFVGVYGSQKLKHQPVFIVGAPRSGSTILYQVLTNVYDVLYTDNLTCFWYRTFFFGQLFSRVRYGSGPHNTYRSRFGDTKANGGHAPSECGNFWYRWLPRSHHFIDKGEVDKRELERIRKNITTVINYFDRPVIFKNLNMGQRMRMIHELFPEARFIHIRRDPTDNALSIARAKVQNGVSEDDFWSVRPKNFRDLQKLKGYEQICAQLYFIERQIEEDKRLFPERCIQDISYEQFLEDWETEVKKIASGFLKDVPRRSTYDPPFLKRPDISAEESKNHQQIEVIYRTIHREHQ